MLDFVIMMPLGPMLMKEFALSVPRYGYLVASYTVMAAISSLLSVFWLDKLDRKKALLGLLLGFTVSNGLCIWAPHAGVLLLGRILAGMFGGVMNAVVFSMIAEHVHPLRRGRASGVLGAAFPLVSILGVPLGLELSELYSWRSAFMMVLLLNGLGLLLAFWVLPETPPQRSEEKTSLWTELSHLVRYPPHASGLLVMICMVFGGFTLVPYFAPYLIHNGFIAEGDLSSIYFVGGLAAIVSSRVVGLLSDRYGKMVVMRGILVLTVLSLLFFTNLKTGSFLWVIVSSSLTMMALPGRFVCFMAYITLVSQPERRGSYMSLLSTVQQMTIGLATLVGGILVGEQADGTLGTMWLAGLFAIFFNLLIFLATFRLIKFEQIALNS